MGLDDFELEPSSAEPDEWDPEADQHDPTADGLTIPSVSTAESEAPAEVRQTFWIVTLVVNAAILFVSVGPMLIYFQGWTRRGLALIVAGLVLFGLAYRRYRTFMENAPDEEGEGQPERPADADGDSIGAAAREGATGPPERSEPSADDAAETLSGSERDPANQHDTETTR